MSVKKLSASERQILGKKLLIVTAHPDDESYMVAGTVRRNREAGGTSAILCATFGERGKSHLKKPHTIQQLKATRKRELIAASKVMGAATLYMPGLPDTKVGHPSNVRRLRSYLEDIVRKNRPELIIGFNRDGISGHLDHIAAGKVAHSVAKKFKIPHLACAPSPRFARRRHMLKHRRKHGVYTDRFHDTKPALRIRIDPKIKIRALRCHKSQLDRGSPFSSIPQSAARSLARWEYFARYSS